MPSLQCPDCGQIEMQQALNGAVTFRCSGCGRALKVPLPLREPAPATSGNDGTRATRAGGAPGAGPAAAPAALPDNGTTAMRPADQPAGAPATAVAPAVAPLASGTATGAMTAAMTAEAPRPAPASGATSRVAPPPRIARPARVPVPWWQRLAVWVLALPLSLAIVFAGARRLRLLSKDDLLNTFTTVGWDRFVPVARLVPVAALLCATIVQVLVTYLERRAAAPPRGARARRGESTGS